MVVGQVFGIYTSKVFIELSSNHRADYALSKITGSSQERKNGCFNSRWSDLRKKSHSWQEQHCHDKAAEYNICEYDKNQVTDTKIVVPSHGQYIVDESR